MSSTLPASLGFVKPFIKKAEEMKQHDPVIAYFCKFHAVDLALKRRDQIQEQDMHQVVQWVTELEQEKAALADHEAMVNDTVSRAYMERFALDIFQRADDEDRAGRSTIKTANAFLAASVFLEATRYFGELTDDIEEKIKYAKWKAVDIAKAIKQGRTPVPGPYQQQQETSTSTTTTPISPITGVTADQPTWSSSYPTTTTATTTTTTTATSTSPSPNPATSDAAPPLIDIEPTSVQVQNTVNVTTVQATSPLMPAVTSPIVMTTPTHVVATSQPEGLTSAVVAAEKHVRYARSALQYEDVRTAVKNLRQALALLEPYDV